MARYIDDALVMLEERGGTNEKKKAIFEIPIFKIILL